MGKRARKLNAVSAKRARHESGGGDDGENNNVEADTNVDLCPGRSLNTEILHDEDSALSMLNEKNIERFFDKLQEKLGSRHKVKCVMWPKPLPPVEDLEKLVIVFKSLSKNKVYWNFAVFNIKDKSFICHFNRIGKRKNEITEIRKTVSEYYGVAFKRLDGLKNVNKVNVLGEKEEKFYVLLLALEINHIYHHGWTIYFDTLDLDRELSKIAKLFEVLNAEIPLEESAVDDVNFDDLNTTFQRLSTNEDAEIENDFNDNEPTPSSSGLLEDAEIENDFNDNESTPSSSGLLENVEIDYDYDYNEVAPSPSGLLDENFDTAQEQEDNIVETLHVAEGELALEESLKQVQEYWQFFNVDLENYQNKTRLIRGCDDLFNKLKEDLDSLAAMKQSPFFSKFENEIDVWGDRLQNINVLFDVWIDVQRRWVFVEGLFSGSADIATKVPIVSDQFNSVNTEFLDVMGKVANSPRILDLAATEDIQRHLERLAEMFAEIQKSLGDYLESERSTFPRFYLVGDEDLLEIIGNSTDIFRIKKHLNKLFAGISALEYNDKMKLITGMVSREGELVELNTPIDLNKTPNVTEWLKELESEMRKTLAKLLAKSLEHFTKFDLQKVDIKDFVEWVDSYPAQILEITVNIWWSQSSEKRLGQSQRVDDVLASVEKILELLSDSVLRDQPFIRRKKIAMLITVCFHKRDITRELVSSNVVSTTDSQWLNVMRYYFSKDADPSKCCVVKMANAEFFYGFEYLGVQEKLVQTPLTDYCYLTMTQALHDRLGGSLFGPAGTGKTESIKALGQQLGRFVLVFKCNEIFDFQVVGRILVGLCQVGAWGCFDEFHRLEEPMLSSVSQQIHTIQENIKAGGDSEIAIVGKNLSVNLNTYIFITINSECSGCSNLPDNLKQLFRSFAMTHPDRNIIAEVMLFSQGFRTAETLAKKIVPFFNFCQEKFSKQYRYDFGLPALKYVLVSAGNNKRDQIRRMKEEAVSKGENVIETDIGDQISEQQILIQSVYEMLMPKLVFEDITLLKSLLQDVFPDVEYQHNKMDNLRDAIGKICDQLKLSYGANKEEREELWIEKVFQLYQIINLNHGVMLVGQSGSGKTMAWKVLLKALESLEKIEGVAHVIDAKAMSKDSLYGVLDANTREWTDGLFTKIIRKIIDNVHGEADKRQWIIFDGDVDPEWVENLNSVLDDNKLLTLPNGERLSIPANVRIIFEVCKYATSSSVSRCGIIWF